MDYLKYLPVDVAKTDVGSVHVSTILCLAYSPSGDVQVAETMIFLNDGPVAGLEDQDGARCRVDQAKEQHDRWVAKVRQAVGA